MNRNDESMQRDLRYTIEGGQDASIILDPISDSQIAGRETRRACHARLLDLSEHGARLEVPAELPVKEAFRLRLSIHQYAVYIYLLAEVCWIKPGSGGQWEVGCRLEPGIPAGLFGSLAKDGRLDRRCDPRFEGGGVLAMRAKIGPTGRPQKVTLQNFSQGGFCVLAKRAGMPGEELVLFPAASKSLTVEASIQWCLQVASGFFLGCTFSDETAFARLRDVCQGQLLVASN